MAMAVTLRSGQRRKQQVPPGRRRRMPPKGDLLFSVKLSDCDVQTFRSGGKGGQNQNKRDTGVRIIHRDSGAAGEARDERSQLQNKKLAFKRMVDHKKFRIWVNRQIWFRGELPEVRVRRDMQPHNLRVEGRKDEKWVPIPVTSDK
jgi:RF-1 domain